MSQIKKSQYRQRVYQSADGSIELVYGESSPTDSAANLLADHDVTELITVVDHVAPTN